MTWSVLCRRRFAFIRFSQRAEALAALDHPDPVLGQPSIKLNWATHNFEKQTADALGKGVPPGKGTRRGGVAVRCLLFFCGGVSASGRGERRDRVADVERAPLRVSGKQLRGAVADVDRR